VEVERVYREWDVALRWAPFLLDPSIPPEGRQRKPQTSADTPRNHLELMGEQRGIEFRRGRTFTPNSHRALQAAEFAANHGTPEQVLAYHRALFKANFTDFEDISRAEVLVRAAADADLDGDALARALDADEYRARVDEGIAHSYEAGVTGIPTFIFDDRYAVVGAQEYATFAQVLVRLGAQRREGAAGT